MIRLMIGIAAAAILSACSPQDEASPEGDDASAAADLAAVEASRLEAFVSGDWDLLDQLHADDFELINPSGEAFTKAEYLDPMKTGDFRYLIFEPVGDIRASASGEAGAVRYRSSLSVQMGETVLPAANYRHTDYYEKRDGRWVVVFSQATPEQQPGD